MFDGIDLGETTPAELKRIERNRPNYFLSLARKRPMARSPMRKSRPKTVPRLVKAFVLARCDGKCERCKAAGVIQLHHRVKRSQGGPNIEANLIGLCPSCHRWVEDNPAAAVAEGWTIQLRKAS